jgi:hypothetical protein
MKKKLVLLSLLSVLSFNCASTKPTQKPIEQPVELVDKFGEGESKGLMELLVAGLVIYILHSVIR